jgi:DNA-binding transcriptional LysR family regulator
MELRHLRYFIAVAEELHFGRAAQRLHVSQPPLSQQIRQFEDELGVRLFERTTQRVTLTEAGRALLPEARNVIAQAERAVRAARSAARGEVQRLEVSFVVTLDHGLVSHVIAAFRKRHPKVAIGLSQMTSVEQIVALREGRIDAGFVRMPLDHRGVECDLVARDPFVLALPATHRLARRRTIDLTQLAQEPFVMLEARQHPRFQAACLELCRHAGFIPNVVQESERLQNLAVMVAGGIGLALLPQSMTVFRTPGVVFRRLSGAAGKVLLDTGLIYRKGERPPIVEAFLDTVRHQGRERARDAGLPPH